MSAKNELLKNWDYRLAPRCLVAGAVLNALAVVSLRAPMSASGIVHVLAMGGAATICLIISIAGMLYCSRVFPTLFSNKPFSASTVTVSFANGLFGGILICWFLNMSVENAAGGNLSNNSALVGFASKPAIPAIAGAIYNMGLCMISYTMLLSLLLFV